MLKLLLKVRLASMLAGLAGNFRSRKKLGAGKIVLLALLYAYLVAAFIFMFFSLFISMAEPMHESGLDWFYFAMFVMTAFSTMFVLSVFTAKAQLFEARDNELLLSLPVPPRCILASRMLSLLLSNYLFELLVALPALAAWCIACPVTGGLVVSFVLVCLCLPLFSVALSAFFGWLLALVTARVRRKSLVSTVISLAFLAAYIYVVSNINTLLSGLLTNAGHIAGSVSAVLPVYWLAEGVAKADFIHLALGLACLVLPFVLCYIILSATFIKTATTRRGFAKARYVEREARISSPFGALVRREWDRLLSSSTYIMNSAMGALLSVVGAAVLAAKGGDLLPLLELLPEGYAAPIAALLLCTVSSMTTISACSVSIEGKNLWIVRSMPVPAIQALKAKLALHLAISAPSTLLMQLAACFVLRPTGLGLVWMLLLPQLFGLVMALLGLWANLRHPRLDWISETQAVKQGIAVAIALFGGWGIVLLPVAAGVLLARFSWGLNAVAAAFLVLLAALCVLLWRWIKRRGADIFASL